MKNVRTPQGGIFLTHTVEQKLLLTAYRKSYSYMRNRLVSEWMTLTFV